jgi:hypothetical protein
VIGICAKVDGSVPSQEALGMRRRIDAQAGHEAREIQFPRRHLGPRPERVGRQRQERVGYKQCERSRDGCG